MHTSKTDLCLFDCSISCNVHRYVFHYSFCTRVLIHIRPLSVIFFFSLFVFSMKQSFQRLVLIFCTWCAVSVCGGSGILFAQGSGIVSNDESPTSSEQRLDKSGSLPVYLNAEQLQTALQTRTPFRGELLYNIVLSNGGTSADGFTARPTVIPVYRQPKGSYLENVVMVKTKQMYTVAKGATSLGSGALQNTLSAYSVKNVRHVFAHFGQGKLASVDEEGVSRWYEVRFSAPFDVYDVCKDLMNNPDVEAAEPNYINTLSQDRFIPTDPRYAEQYEWQRIQAERAWAVTRGSANVLIAIVDSGVDINHEDLAEKIWTNPGESGTDAQGRDRRTNGIDDDGNGKIDDWRGWDFIGNVNADERGQGIFRQNNFPFSRRPGLATGDGQNHGVHVAGSAAGATNNGRGGSSGAHNCLILPVKCSTDDPLASTSVFSGYEGIMYSAEMGASIINCSWGGAAGSAFAQNVVNQATAMGSLVVAAAGNAGIIQDVAQYPADFFNVLSVGASDIRDLPVATANGHFFGTNFGIGTDVFAPGFNILSTVSENRYALYSGTSMASPVTAGITALVRTVNPTWRPFQVLQQIRSSSDNILLSSGATVRPVQYYGRLNAFRAVTVNRSFTSGERLPGISHNERVLVASPTGIVNTTAPTTLRIVLQNHLAGAQNVRVNIVPVTVSPLARVFDRLAVQSPDVQIASLGTNQTVNADFTVQLLAGAFTGTGTRRIDLLMTITADGGYVNYERVALFYDVAAPTSTQQLAVLTNTVEFPATADLSVVPALVRNIGTAPIAYTSATITGANANEFSLQAALVQTPLATATNRTINVVLTPRSEGTKSATLTLSGQLAPTPIQAYTFTSAQGTYTEISGGTVYRNATNPAALLDDDEFTIASPFPFRYGGTLISTMRLSSNGFIGFDVSGLTPISNALTTTVTATGIVAGMNRDLVARADGGELSSAVIGTAPNRVFVAQWRNYSFWVAGGTLPNTRVNFQIRLYETSNRVEVIYGTVTNDAVISANPLTLYTVQSGLRGTSNADFNNREVIFGGASSWVNSLRGTVNSATLAVLSNPPAANSNAIPPAGLTYAWLPGTGTNQNLPTITTQIPLTGTVNSASAVLRTTSASIAFGAVTIGQSLIRPVVLQNTSFVPISSITSLLTGNASSDYRIVSNASVSTIAPGSTATVLVEFRPSMIGEIAGSRKAELVVQTPSAGTLIVDLRGTGAGTVAGSTAQRILRAGFGTQADLASTANITLDITPLPRVGGEVNSTTFTLRNRGTQPIVVSTATFSGIGASEYSIQTPLPMTIQPGQSSPLFIRFSPRVAGEKSPTLTFTGTMDDNTTVNVFSAGALPRFIGVTARTATNVLNSSAQELFPVSVPLTSVGGFTTAGTLTLTNSTGVIATVSSITLSGANAGDFSIISPQFPVTLSAGSTATVRLRFAPTAVGVRTALATLTHTAPGLQTETVRVSGTAVSSRQLASSTVNAWVMQSNVNESIETSGFTVINRGSDTVRITRVYMAGRNANEFSISTGAQLTVIAPGQTASFGVRFSPRTVGSKFASMMMESNADQSLWNIVNVSGVAVGGLLAPLTPNSANIGDTITLAVRTAAVVNPNNTALAGHTGLLRFNASTFAPLAGAEQGVVRNGTRFVPFTFASLSPVPDDSVVAQIRVRVLLPFNSVPEAGDPFAVAVGVDSVRVLPGGGVGLSSIGIASSVVSIVRQFNLRPTIFNATVNQSFTVFNASATPITPQFNFLAIAPGANVSAALVPNTPIAPNGFGTVVLSYSGDTPGTRTFGISPPGVSQPTVNFSAITIGGSLTAPSALTGRPGETVNLTFSLANITNPTAVPFSGLTARVRFNASLLEPVDPARRGTVSNGIRTITLNAADLSPTNPFTIPCRVALGSDTATTITVDNIVSPQNALGFIPVNGRFSLRGVNQAGGSPRVIISPRTTLVVTAISPNPSNGVLNTTLTATDDAMVTVTLRDISGAEVLRFAPRSIAKGLPTPLVLDCSGVASGSYMLSFSTADDAVSIPVVVVK